MKLHFKREIVKREIVDDGAKSERLGVGGAIRRRVEFSSFVRFNGNTSIMTSVNPTPQSPSKLPTWPVRVFAGMLVGATLGSLTTVLVIESQVVLLRKHTMDVGRDWPRFDPDLFATLPRMQYRRWYRRSILPTILGGVAGAVFGARRRRRNIAVVILLVGPILYAGFGWHELVTDYKPSISESFSDEKRQRHEETLRRMERQP